MHHRRTERVLFGRPLAALDDGLLERITVELDAAADGAGSPVFRWKTVEAFTLAAADFRISETGTWALTTEPSCVT